MPIPLAASTNSGVTEFIPDTVFFKIGRIAYKNTAKTTVFGPVPIKNMRMASMAREGIVCITFAMLIVSLDSFLFLATAKPRGIARIDANKTP